MSYVKLSAVLAAGLFALAAMQPACAASPISEAFLANVTRNVAFLDRSSRMAEHRAEATPLRAFAKDEVAEATSLSASLDVLTPGDHRFAVAAVSTGPDGLMTGRSVAARVDVKPAGFGQAANARMPMGATELDRLETLSGGAFDNLYWMTQLDALSQLRADYTSYIAHGDDTALVAIARRELPKVEHRLLELTRL